VSGISAESAAGTDARPSVLRFRATAAYIASARLFAVTLGRHYGLTNETLEDLRLAVSEACTLAVESGGGPTGRPVELSLRCTGEGLQVEIQDVGEQPSEDSDPARQSDGGLRQPVGRLQLVSMLFGDAEVLPGEAGAHLLRFSAGPTSGGQHVYARPVLE
jgi:anti-sigma regulatory factor (Ser/Thr protein kinase)